MDVSDETGAGHRGVVPIPGICNQTPFLPATTGRPAFSDDERKLIALPVRDSGLGIPVPTSNACETCPLGALPCLHRIFSEISHFGTEMRRWVHAPAA